MGVEKLADAAMHTMTKNGIGFTPSCCDKDSASGKERAAAALFVISSVKMLVMMNIAASSTLCSAANCLNWLQLSALPAQPAPFWLRRQPVKEKRT